MFNRLLLDYPRAGYGQGCGGRLEVFVAVRPHPSDLRNGIDSFSQSTSMLSPVMVSTAGHDAYVRDTAPGEQGWKGGKTSLFAFLTSRYKTPPSQFLKAAQQAVLQPETTYLSLLHHPLNITQIDKCSPNRYYGVSYPQYIQRNARAKTYLPTSSKPLHPATVHFPISFLALSYGLDTLYTLRPNLPETLTSTLPVATDLTRASYYLLSLGLITSIPAVMSGGAQAFKMISKQGLYEADNKTVKPKVKATIVHALANDVVILLSAYMWWCRRAARNETVEAMMGKTMGVDLGAATTQAAAYAPAGWMAAVSVVMTGLLFWSASIGGALTYNYGVGFAPKSGASVKKAQ